MRSVVRAGAIALCCFLAASLSIQKDPGKLGPDDLPELRALWVDAFHAGARSPQEIDELVATARRANLNTLFVQVLRRGDVLYTQTNEPPLDDPAYDPRFDGLAYVVDAAHRA